MASAGREGNLRDTTAESPSINLSAKPSNNGPYIISPAVDEDESMATMTNLCVSTERSRSPEQSVPPKYSDRNSDSNAIRFAEDGLSQGEVSDLKVVHPVSSGPAYSAFSTRQRRYIVFMVACAGFFSPLSANIYFPALTSLSRDLRVSNSLINLSLTSYMIFQGLAPTIFGDLGDMAGRRPALIAGFVIYIGANVGLALQNNYAALLVLRCLQSTGSSGTVALGNGVVADIASSGERGKFIGIDVGEVFRDSIDSNRHCPTWSYGCSCNSARGRRYSYPIPWLEVAFLVLDYPCSGVFGSLLGNFPRNGTQSSWQWIYTTSRLEHVSTKPLENTQA